MAEIRVFVSYSHEDSRWLDPHHEYCLIPWLQRYLGEGVKFWYDRWGIPAGDDFRQRIETEIDKAHVALVLVSYGFLASQFIREVELPRIQERAEKGELVVIPILIEPCTWEEIDFLASRQMIPGKPTPLVDYTESRREWARARDEIGRAISHPISKLREAPGVPVVAPSITGAEVSPVPIPRPPAASKRVPIGGAEASEGQLIADVFISHVEEDADVALEIAGGLEAEGYTTWYYERDSIPGPAYLIQVGEAIEQCQAVVVVISPDSLGSNQVTVEVVRGHESSKHFIPVLRDITHAEFQTRQPQWRTAMGAATSVAVPREGISPILPHLIAGLKALGIQPTPGEVTDTKPVAAESGQATLAERSAREAIASAGIRAAAARRKRVMISAGAAAAVVLVAAWAAVHFWHGPAPTLQSDEESSTTPLHEGALRPHAEVGHPLLERGELRCFEGHTGPVASVAFSPDGRRILSGSWDKTVRLWDVETGAEIRCFTGHTDAIGSVVFSPEGRWVASGSTDETVRLWDVPSGKRMRTFEGHRHAVYAVALAPDGRQVLSAAPEEPIILWNVDTGTVVYRLDGHTGAVGSVAFSPDGRRAVSAAADRTIALWDVPSRERVGRFEGHTDGVNTVAFSPDGRQIVSGGDDATVRVWDVDSAEQMCCFQEPDKVYAVAFSPVGDRVLSGCRDSTVRLWQVSTGAEIARFQRHSDLVKCVAFSPAGHLAVSGGHDNTVRMWDLPEADDAEEAPR